MKPIPKPRTPHFDAGERAGKDDAIADRDWYYTSITVYEVSSNFVEEVEEWKRGYAFGRGVVDGERWRNSTPRFKGGSMT